ncbi:MAG: bacteriocin fulvocin C-related protein [Sphingobacteriales bacterium]|nr:bacteriocin fulvocin C-related protein [Sphingobacteriales bacterium]
MDEAFTKEQTYLLVECAYTNGNFSIFKADKYLANLESSKNSPIAAASVACSCRYDIGCGFGNLCNSGGCPTTNGGCGLFGTSSCTGTCSQGNGGPIIK